MQSQSQSRSWTLSVIFELSFLGEFEFESGNSLEREQVGFPLGETLWRGYLWLSSARRGSLPAQVALFLRFSRSLSGLAGLSGFSLPGLAL